MERIVPANAYASLPCTIVACGSALECMEKAPAGSCMKQVRQDADQLDYHADGYLSLEGTNKLVRGLMKVKRGGYKYYKRNERRKLRDFDFTDKQAIVMVYGHCIFVDGHTYTSYFNNELDDVVAVWELETK
jgi:hypothetical protein